MLTRRKDKKTNPNIYDALLVPSGILKPQPAQVSPNLTLIPYNQHILADRMRLEQEGKIHHSKEYLEVRNKILKVVLRAKEVLILEDKTFQLAIRIFDKVAHILNIQMEFPGVYVVVCCCLMIASKFLDCQVVSISTFCYLVGKSNEDQTRTMETHILSIINFDLVIPLVHEYYEFLFMRKPSELLILVCMYSDFAGTNRLCLAKAIGMLQDDNEYVCLDDTTPIENQRLMQKIRSKLSLIHSQ